MSSKLSTCARRAFTLIELMVVLLIIGVIIAIVLPALGLVRNKVRAETTKTLLTQINNAVGSFNTDHKKMPGYFTAREMASQENLTRGMSAMQNVMMDLAGFTVDPNGTDIGPTAASQIKVDLSLMGAPSPGNDKLYYVPDAKHWIAQNVTGQQNASIAGHQSMLSVVDEFRNPILAWVQDETSVGQVKLETDFAAASITGNVPSPRYAWAPNATFLSSNALGARGYDQTGANGSMIGSTAAGPSPAAAPANVEKSLCGILGNPAYPYNPVPPTGVAPTVPSTGRAPLILHSAGIDGIFVGKRDRGAKQFTQPYVDYQLNFVNRSGGNPANASDIYTDKDGKREIIDVMHKFDDILAGGGN